MRVDVVSIFPDYLAPLDLSLVGRARRSDLLDLQVHDLRDFTHDRHRTVDDTPYGGGAGMVMRVEPWGEALDAVVGAYTSPSGAVPTLVVPTPAGIPFTQRVADLLATRDHLVIACGRYEGIDQRVVDDAARGMEVVEVSLGDVVLNGGEVAALAVVEAVVRLLPGFMGNPDSLADESHGADGLLEAPVYTKPASWRGLDVPEVLMSGDHARIAAWRRAAALRRTVERRPDLAARAGLVGLDGPTPDVLDGLDVATATRADGPELYVLQRCCWVDEAHANPGVEIPALHESLEVVADALADWTTVVVRDGHRLVASVRGRRDPADPTVWAVGRLMVAPDLRGRGLGGALLAYAEGLAPDDVTVLTLITGSGSAANLRLYRRRGYRVVGEVAPGAVRLERRRGRASP